MEINKNYYFALSAKGQITSGECDHEAISNDDLEAFKAVLQPALDDNSLFTGKDLKVKEVSSYNVRAKKVVTSTIVTNFCNIEFADGKITVAEHHSGKSQLRVWYRAEDYEKAESDDQQADSTDNGDTTDDAEF
jgi:hypothetical protein